MSNKFKNIILKLVLGVFMFNVGLSSVSIINSNNSYSDNIVYAAKKKDTKKADKKKDDSKKSSGKCTDIKNMKLNAKSPKVDDAVLEKKFKEWNMPFLTGHSKDLKDASKKTGINLGFLIGLFRQENGGAPNGTINTKNNNPGNLLDISGDAGQYTLANGRKGAKWSSMRKGIFATAELLQNYVKKGTDTIAKTIPIYAPGSDGNNEGGYIGLVSSSIKALGQDAECGSTADGDDSVDDDGTEGDLPDKSDPWWNPFNQVNYQEQGSQTGVQNKDDLVSDDAIIKLDNFLQQHKGTVFTIQLIFTLVIILTVIGAIMGQYILLPGVPGYKLYEKIFNFQLEYGTRKLVWITAFTVIFLLACVWSNLYLYAMAWFVKLISMVMQMLHLA